MRRKGESSKVAIYRGKFGAIIHLASSAVSE